MGAQLSRYVDTYSLTSKETVQLLSTMNRYSCLLMATSKVLQTFSGEATCADDVRCLQSEIEQATRFA